MFRVFSLGYGDTGDYVRRPRLVRPRTLGASTRRSHPRRAGLRAFVIPAILTLLLTTSCDDTPAGSSDTAHWRLGTSETFLQSKVDDDDGDGNFFDEDFPRINDEDDDIADHAWVRDDHGVYHLFFQNEALFSPSDIEHYTTTDFRTLTYVGVALRLDPGAWDSNDLWAPHIVKAGGVYFMFYTGVDADGAQRIGLATSRDLMTWTRYRGNNCPGTSGDGCIYQCDECWTAWSDSVESFNQQCRDPFVIWDSDNHRWVLFATAKSVNQFGEITVAYSHDLVDWEGAGFIDATRRLSTGSAGQPTGGQAENAFVMSHNGTHYLLFSDWQDPEDSDSVTAPRTITQYATSATLTADTSGSANWTYRAYIPDPGVNAIEVQVIHGVSIMSQSIANPHTRDHVTHRRQLRLKCVDWGANFTFGTSNVAFFPDGRDHALGPMGVGVSDGPSPTDIQRP